MTLSNDELKIFCFRFLNNEISLKDFESWVYTTPELEKYLGEDAYFEIISFNFHQPAATYEFSKLINKHIVPVEFYNWKLKHLLQSLLDDTLDPVDVFENLYELAYSKGYYFLRNIGIQYVIWIDQIPKRTAEHLWDAKEYQRLRETLGKYLPSTKQEIELMLQAIDSGDLKVIKDGEYQISPNFAQKLKDLQKSREIEQQKEIPPYQPISQKKWWQFWK